MKTDKDVLQALIDGYTLTNSAKEIIYLDQSGDYIGVDLSKISPEDWSILKPTITINGYEITPEVKHPKEGQKYYFPLLTQEELYLTNEWSGTFYDDRILERKLLHLTKESAIEHAKALLSLVLGK